MAEDRGPSVDRTREALRRQNERHSEAEDDETPETPGEDDGKAGEDEGPETA